MHGRHGVSYGDIQRTRIVPGERTGLGGASVCFMELQGDCGVQPTAGDPVAPPLVRAAIATRRTSVIEKKGKWNDLLVGVAFALDLCNVSIAFHHLL